ncbi:MAG: DUF2167 domain-containing protein, partial [Verrucomicrobiota bacterium]
MKQKPYHPLPLPLFTAAFLILPLAAWAQDAPSEESAEEPEMDWGQYVETFGWSREGTGELSQRATIEIPQGYRFTNGAGAAQLMEAYGNRPSGNEQGLIAPEDLDWCVLFRFDPQGYVKDDEKDNLDAGKLLKTLQDGQEQANQQRVTHGLDTLTITGWAMEPNYNNEIEQVKAALGLDSSWNGRNPYAVGW